LRGRGGFRSCEEEGEKRPRSELFMLKSEGGWRGVITLQLLVGVQEEGDGEIGKNDGEGGEKKGENVFSAGKKKHKK